MKLREITNMNWWFRDCCNLREIIYPEDENYSTEIGIYLVNPLLVEW